VSPVSLPLLALTPVNYFKNYLDPTAAHVPIIGRNNEAKLFRRVEQFRFVDGDAFDGVPFRAAFPLTMHELNDAVPDGISDHVPLIVDLPFKEP
jgi:hypothetical protein